MKYINIEKHLIPYEFDITLEDETYTFRVHYNNEKDFFTLDLLKNERVIIVGEKIVYARPLFVTSQHKNIPRIGILPYDLTQRAERVTYENFNKQVFLFLVGD